MAIDELTLLCECMHQVKDDSLSEVHIGGTRKQ